MKEFSLKTAAFILFFISVYCQSKKEIIQIKDVGYRYEDKLLELKFKIVNLSDDTLFISSENLNVKMLKNGEILKPDYSSIHVQPFIKPVKADNVKPKVFKQERKQHFTRKDKLIESYTVKVFEKNVKINEELKNYRQAVYKSIRDNSIVLLPHEIYNFERGYYYDIDEKPDTIKVFMNESKVLTSIYDNNGNKINILSLN